MDYSMIDNFLGIGAYTIPEAARLIGTNAPLLRRWVKPDFYTKPKKEHLSQNKALWKIQHDEVGDPMLGFRDLIEARIVRALRNAGISLQSIRLCLERAREIIHDDHPFSTSLFKTDGSSIFLQITDGLDDIKLIDLKMRQHVFRDVVLPSFMDLEFGNSAVVKWWPMSGKKSIVIDPLYSFGQPIIAGKGISTKRICELVSAEKSKAVVSRFYDLSMTQIDDALKYELSLKH
jgi:uncharacterized protein (DUF433 family)